MSALAYILAKRQLPVSGSDLRSSHITDRLAAAGAHIFLEQVGENLNYFDGEGGLPQVICSTAIAPTNAEYQAARERGCDLFHRSDVLAALLAEGEGLAVAGTHGKTTTSSLLGHVLVAAGCDPTVIVGGEVATWEGNARVGAGPYVVAEADESDGSLVKLKAKIGVITNIELDHPDHYQDLAQVVAIFRAFSQQCEMVVGCLDCDTIRQSLSPHIGYSLRGDRGAAYTVTEVTYHGEGSRAKVWERGQELGWLEVKLLGPHNLSNALAVIAVARQLDLDFSTIAAAIASFDGAKRRFEYRGEVAGATLIDDYAHHPSEIQVTLAAARLKVTAGQYQRVVAVFQPHRYSRTRHFLGAFAQSFAAADWVVVTDVYAAGEPPDPAVSGPKLAEAIAQFHPAVVYGPPLQELPQFLLNQLQAGDLVLFLGAGNLNQVIPLLLTHPQPLPV